MITQITDHSERAKNRLPDQFSGAVNLQNLIEIISGIYQELENVDYDLLTKRSLSVATGKQLDNLGTILDANRITGESDTEYRSRLFAATSQLEKSGEAETIIEIYNLLIGSTVSHFYDLYPASFQITSLFDLDPNDSEQDQYTKNVINNAKAGGIEVLLMVSPETEGFILCDASEVDINDNGVIDVDHGLSDLSQVSGGQLARVL